MDRELDQFYTTQEVSKYFMNKLNTLFNLNNFYLVEPSAGTGSFSSLFHNNSIAFDIDPKDNINMIKKNFLLLKQEELLNKGYPIFSIGNPPFGKNSSLAIRFINHSSKFSKYIAFILPKTFKKISTINKINKNLHLIFEEDVKENSFIFKNKTYNVPCVFQIWEKKDKLRKNIYRKLKTDIFDFVTKEEADFAIRRVGVFAGKIFENFENYKESSHYFIKVNKNKEEVKIKINSLYNELQEVALNTAGNPSLSKHEFIEILEKYSI